MAKVTPHPSPPFLPLAVAELRLCASSARARRPLLVACRSQGERPGHWSPHLCLGAAASKVADSTAFGQMQVVGSFAQSKEAFIVYLAVYSVFVPIFQIHHLTMAMLMLTCVQMALFVAYGLINNAGERETYKNMLALEAYIAVILNMLGVGIAHLADRQTRSNFSRAKPVPRVTPCIHGSVPCT